MSDATSTKSDVDAIRILRERAQALARPAAPAGVAGATLELLEFRLAGERYAVETRQVREVYPLKDLTAVPCTPPFVRGVVNVRGRVVPVIDIKRFFDLPERGLTDLHRVVLVGGAELELGLLVDDVAEVAEVAAESLQPTLPTLTPIGAEYLKGVTAQRVVVLDVERILADPRIVVHEEVEE